MVGDLKKNKAAQVTEDAQWNREEVLEDFRICCVSREVSLMARKEVLTGKAKFAVTGDGKEVPQVAMAKAFMKGDYRAGYYRDQTWMFALGIVRRRLASNDWLRSSLVCRLRSPAACASSMPVAM